MLETKCREKNYFFRRSLMNILQFSRLYYNFTGYIHYSSVIESKVGYLNFMSWLLLVDSTYNISQQVAYEHMILMYKIPILAFSFPLALYTFLFSDSLGKSFGTIKYWTSLNRIFSNSCASYFVLVHTFLSALNVVLQRTYSNIIHPKIVHFIHSFFFNNHSSCCFSHS
jgi:hypothetical protein